jgi:hypothetical protein
MRGNHCYNALMLPEWFVVFAVALRLASGATYARAVLARQAKPNPITWFFWALTPLIVFTAQLFHLEAVGWGIATTLALGLSPLLVFIVSLRHNWHRSQFTPSTITCGVLAACGILLWLTTNDPVLAIIFSIAADTFASIPTVIKAWRDPKSEFLPAYLITTASVIITAATITTWSFASYAFPAYIFAINVIIFSAGLMGLARKPHKKLAR